MLAHLVALGRWLTATKTTCDYVPVRDNDEHELQLRYDGKSDKGCSSSLLNLFTTDANRTVHEQYKRDNLARRTRAAVQNYATVNYPPTMPVWAHYSDSIM